MWRDDWERLKAFLQLDDEDVARLEAARARAAGDLPAIVQQFYAHLRRFPELAAILDQDGRGDRLAAAQQRYLASLLGAPHDESYQASRRAIGAVHCRIGLAPSWYLGSYALVARLLAPYVEAGGREALGSLLKAIFLDASMAVDAYQEASEAELARSEERFRALVVHAPVAIVLHDDRRVLFANPAAERLLAATRPAELTGRDLVDLAPTPTAGRPAVAPFVVGRTAHDTPATVQVRRLDGRVALVEAQSMPVTVERQPLVMTTLRDVTAEAELRSRLVQLDRLAAVGGVAASVVHEIGNAVTILATNASALARVVKRAGEAARAAGHPAEGLDEARASAETMQISCGQIVQVVRDLHTLGRAGDSGKRCLDLAAVAAGAARIARAEVASHAELTTVLHSRPAIVGSEARLLQVLLNLLSNAVQSLPAGERGHRVEVVVDEAGGEAILEVRDTGGGIPSELQARIFEPFFTTKPGGTGLGLAVCAEIVREHAGRIDVDSQVGVGTTMRVRLPLDGAPSIRWD